MGESSEDSGTKGFEYSKALKTREPQIKRRCLGTDLILVTVSTLVT